jgi:hypothetical protein
MTRFVFIFTLFIFSTRSPLLAQDVDFEKEAGNNIGRLESEDGDQELDVNDQLGEIGPIEFTVSFPQKGEATLALYTSEGQLLRILGQVIPVEAREYRLRWDGLDLFGNLVAAGRHVELRTFFNPGIKVTYEMAIAAPKVAPWPGDYERQGQTLEGGWLGDHSNPYGATSVGNLAFFSYTLAEEGDNLIAVNSNGEKVWGHKLEGWDGPSTLNANNSHVFAINRKKNKVYRIDPTPKQGRKGLTIEQTALLSRPRLEHLTAHGDDVLIIGKTKGADAPVPHPRAFGNRDIDFIRSIPQELNTTPPSDFHISPQDAFGRIFTNGGSPQVNRKMVAHDGYAFFLIVLNDAKTLGTVVLPQLEDVGKIEILTLKEGVIYKESMSPLAGKQSGDLMSLTLEAQGTEWVPFASSDLPEHVNWVTSTEGTVQTQAILVKAYPAGKPKNNWRPAVAMARMLSVVVKPVASKPSRISSPTKLSQWTPSFQSESGWKAVTEFPISDTYPMIVVQEYDRPVSFNTVMAMNAVNPNVFVDMLKEGVSVAEASESDWIELGNFKRDYNKKLGHRTASRNYYDRYLQLKEDVTTRAVRYRMMQGSLAGKWGDSKDNPNLSEAGFVQILTLDRGEDASESKASHSVYWVKASSGELEEEWMDSAYDIHAIDFAPDGMLFTLADGRLNRTEWNKETGEFDHTPLGDFRYSADKTYFMDSDNTRIAIACRNENVVHIFDRKGKKLNTIGDGTPRGPGEWVKERVTAPRGVALTGNGDIWVTENIFAPKRISHFDANGRFVAEHLGPPMYGGGGQIDADLKHFYYRGMEFALAIEKGNSELVRIYDLPYAENTPAASANTFSGIPYHQPVYVNGNRYLVGSGIITRKPDGAEKAIPAAVHGYASTNKFLEHDVWKAHWAKLNLNGKYFVWCDLNEDGMYQVEEVQLADTSSLPRMSGGTFGPDLSLWGSTYRWKPRSFTPKGVPVYQLEDIEPFDYDSLASHYPRNYTLSGPTSAKPTYGAFRYVSTDGYLVQEGQPFVVKPDGTILGGEPPKSSEYIPPISGQVVQTAWSWAGGAQTESPVGEIAIINSFKGAWHIWAVKHGVMLGRFFTGEEGTFNGLDPVRGMDVTKRYMGWEGWHADFVKGTNGKYYAQGGKSFHSVNEVHGLDDYQMTTQIYKLTPAVAELARKLRPVLVSRFTANQGNVLAAYKGSNRLQRSFKLDGLIEDWGDRGQFSFLDEKERTTRFDASFDDEGLLLALDGRGNLDGELRDWKKAPKEGFAVDIQLRNGDRGAQRNSNIIQGDARIYVVKYNGKWRGVLFRPKAENGPTASTLSYPSPTLDLFVDEFRLLGEDEISIFIREKSLDVDLLDLGEGSGGFELDGLGLDDGLMLDSEKSGGETKMGSGNNWTAEIHIPWSIIGKGLGTRRFDIGIRETGPKGRHFFWNNAYPGPKDDPALQMHMNPRAWGTLQLYLHKD